jgi:nitroimidazol reductase NimA-like FMN-containing flavoprotein (pyridoxamine 5'-phosphate oxidase superfamily)
MTRYGMTKEEMEAFLEEGIVAHLACLQEDGSPYAVVCWHEWRDGFLWLVPRQRSRWAEMMERDPRVSFVVEHNIRKVWGEGSAEVVERPNVGGQWVDVATRMAYRYLGENGPTYLVPTLQQPRWLIRIRPETIETWNGVAARARRYWVEDAAGPSFEEAFGPTS